MGNLESDRAAIPVGKHSDGKSWNEGFARIAWAGEYGATDRPHRVYDQQKPGSDLAVPLSEADHATVNSIARNSRDLAKYNDAYRDANNKGELDFKSGESMNDARESLER